MSQQMWWSNFVQIITCKDRFWGTDRARLWQFTRSQSRRCPLLLAPLRPSPNQTGMPVLFIIVPDRQASLWKIIALVTGNKNSHRLMMPLLWWLDDVSLVSETQNMHTDRWVYQTKAKRSRVAVGFQGGYGLYDWNPFAIWGCLSPGSFYRLPMLFKGSGAGKIMTSYNSRLPGRISHHSWLKTSMRWRVDSTYSTATEDRVFDTFG